ncbi:YhgE/Pip C-terminal do [Neocallimastix lanati (nom. inval.)]|nr:YhgE/Pip C-terminal do [Neocallimastix sp. JGI-2020a]
MRKILAIFIYDLKQILKNPAAAFVLFGLAFIPGLYAWLNIDSNWNPYENTGKLPIAIVNKDKGTVILEKNLNIGDSLVDSLKSNNAMKWYFTEEKDAREKVTKSEFYGEIDIPADFSKNLVSIFQSGEIKSPELDFYINQKRNAIAPVIVTKAMETIENTLDQNIVNALIYKSLCTAQGMKLFVKNIKSTDDIIDRLNEGKESIYDLKSIFNIMRLISHSINNSLGAIRNLLPAVNSLTNTSKEGLNNLQGTIKSVKDLSGDLESALASIESTGSDIVKIAKSLDLNAPKENAAILSKKIDEINAKLSSNKKRVQNVQSFLGNVNDRIPLKLKGITALQKELQKVVNEINDAQTVIANNRQTKEDIQKINGKLKDIKNQQKGVADTYKTYKNDIKKNIEDASDKGGKSMAMMSGLLNEMDGTTTNADASLASLMKALGNTKDLTNNLEDVCSNLQNDIVKIIDSLGESKTREIFDKVVNLIQNDPVDVANFFSKPVEAEENDIYGRDKYGNQLSYGSKMAPFCTVLACWIGCVLLITIIKLEITGMEGVEKFKNYQKFLGRFAIFALMAVLQGFILAVGDLILKVQVQYPFYFILSIMMTSFVFMLFVYSIVLSFGRIGLAFSVIFLVLQIAGTGGTFPVEMLPKPYQVALPITPFYPALNLMRETIGGFYGNYYLKYMLILFSHTIIPLLLGLIFRTPIIHMLEKVDKELEKTAMIV